MITNKAVKPSPTVCAACPLHATCKTGQWHVPAKITPNNFVHKSLSNFAFNPALGCAHGCLFCYVPDASTRKMRGPLAEYGVTDPDKEWGDYVLVRPWKEKTFMTSLQKADRIPLKQLKRDGHRAVMMSSTTDPYQIVRHTDPAEQRALSAQLGFSVTRALELIRDHSTLNVRVLTRSPLARQDFELYKTFGPRLMFGMSLPTLRNDLAKIYEPKAPAPTQRLATLKAAKELGLNIYVAIAPTYPECDDNDLHATLKAVAALEPMTIFHEPINIRAKNVERIEAHAAELEVKMRTEVFETNVTWQNYAFNALRTVQLITRDLGIENRLHLWPDAALGSRKVIERMPNPNQYKQWLHHWWNRISEWPQQ